MSDHPKNDVTIRSSSSHANLRDIITSQSDSTPRKATSHESFSKSGQEPPKIISNEILPARQVTHSKNLNRGIQYSSNNSHSNTSTNTSNSTATSAGMSTFSYLKARLFGSVADASTSLTSSARDLLQLKKAAELNKGLIPESSSTTRLETTTEGDNSRNQCVHKDSLGQLNKSSTTDPPTISVNSPPYPAQDVISSHRFFSRTLPNRRQPHEPLRPALNKQTMPTSPIGPFNPSTLESISTSNNQILSRTACSNIIHVSSPTSATQVIDLNQRRLSAASSSDTQVHPRTGSIVFQEGFLNKKMEQHSGEIEHDWKIYKVILKSSKIYFYKPLPMDDWPQFQSPKDPQKQCLSSNILQQDHTGYYHQHHSFPNNGTSPQLSIASECGMVLSAFNFESSTRTLLFEGNTSIKSLNHEFQSFASPVSKYVYGECFTEIDRLTMQFKKHVALLLFEDSVVICKRKWVRYTSAKVKDVIKFSSNSNEKNEHQEPVSGKRQGSLSGISHKSSDSRGSDGDQRIRAIFDSSTEKQRGYFSKWKHEATYPLSQVEALDMASPVPSASATFYPFAAPVTAAATNPSYFGRNLRDLDIPSISTATSISSSNHQSTTTSTLELVITSNIDGRDYTHRLLYLPPSQEVRHQWYSKFNRAKGLYQPHTRTASKGRGSVESLVPKDAPMLYSPRSNNSTASLHSPTSPKSSSEAESFILNSNKMDRAQAFCETTLDPKITVRRKVSTGTTQLSGASIDDLIYEIVHNELTDINLELVHIIATTYPLFTTTSHVLGELGRYISLESANSTPDNTKAKVHRIEFFIREIINGYCASVTNTEELEEIRKFTKILQEKCGSTRATDILQRTDAVHYNDSYLANVASFSTNNESDGCVREVSVDLSNLLITGLTPALFLRLEPIFFAEQILHYHRKQLYLIGGLQRLFKNPANFIRPYSVFGTSQSLQNALVFSMYSPHFLTILITHHILIATQSIQSTSRRPKLLAQWIKTARCCWLLGDMAGFVAIAIGICSPGVVRLQETWKQVSLELRQEVAHKWVPILIKMNMVMEDLQGLAISSFGLKSSLHSVFEMSLNGEDSVIPCISNIKQSLDQLDRAMPSFLQLAPVQQLNIEKLRQIYLVLNKASQSISTKALKPQPILSSLENERLQQYFSHLASISQTLHDHYHSNELSSDAFESSLACEPHFIGQYLDYHYKNRKMAGSFIPLMFPEVVPEKRLFPLPLLLTLENTGNTDRKSSFDEVQTIPPGTSKIASTKLPSDLSSTAKKGSEESIGSSATYYRTLHLEQTDSTSCQKSHKRTYSFPPARNTCNSIGSFSTQPTVNMINPHLDALASGCLQSMDEPEPNEVVTAMRNVTCIGYSSILIEGGNLILKVNEQMTEPLVNPLAKEREGDFRRSRLYLNTGGSQSSNTSSLAELNEARSVIVKAGTLEELIYVVVMGLEDRNGKYLDEQGNLICWTSMQFILDHETFQKAFFATYRSFCTANRLLDQFVKMFSFAQDIKPRASDIPSAFDLSPGTQGAFSRASSMARVSHSSSTFDWKRVLTMQLNILKALEYWLRAHADDFLDDLTLKAKLSGALKSISAQEASQKLLLDDSHIDEATALSKKLTYVQQLAVEQMMKPLDSVILVSGTLETFFGHSPLMPPQLNDSWSPGTLLDQLNAAAWAHFLTVRNQEWIILFKVLESQSIDPLGWYLPKVGATPAEEDILITSIHDTLHVVRKNGAPGTHWNGERLLSSLPLCLQNLCRLHHVIRGWVIAQLASPSIAYNVRLDRLQKMLDVITLSRRAMGQFGSGKGRASLSLQSTARKISVGVVPSFVEDAVVSALISPESRAFSHIWLEVASSRKGSVETLEDVLVPQRDNGLLSADCLNQDVSHELVPSIGWLIERFLEACCYVRDMSYESPLLINFDKRQYIYDLIHVYTRRQEELRAIEMTSTPLSSWLGLSNGLSSNLAMKVVRESAQKESSNMHGGSTTHLSSATNISSRSSRFPRIFSRLVSMQYEKIKRDQKELEKLEKQIKDTQDRIQKAQQEQAKILEKQIKLEQSRSRVKNQLLKSTLMRAMRPISLAITNSWSSATTTVSNATALGSAINGKNVSGTTASGAIEALGASNRQDLDMPQLQLQSHATSSSSVQPLSTPKPVLVINLINSTCSVANTYTKRKFVFKVVTEEGGQSLFQALDHEDMLKWIKVINEAAAGATAKRRTLLDNDESLSSAVTATTPAEELFPTSEYEYKGRNSVFGVELRHLMSDGNIPLIVEKCIAEIEKRGLEEVGIYRVPGAVSAINKLRQSFNSGSQNVNLDSDEWKDINVVAGALKQFLRELPEAVMTNALYDSLIAASALADYDDRLIAMKDLIRTLPAPNYILLKRIIEHLERITDHEEINHMYATNLAIVFGPTLLRPGGTSASSFATSMKNL
ncbi:hypothetical protein BCR41DRAFT_227930, partial [Lobosporangium transversale]